ncbi:MAG TPA: ABC transporter ATP-binding protein [Acidimicrobiales bacterium]|nr:ABC transporter ATP-binding protein [Acidimicrobiales bacterium]
MARLELRGIEVRFGGHRALRGIDLDVDAGRVTGLIGPNGAGKTTLFDVVTGLRRPDAGTVVLDGRDVTGLPPHRRARAGLARTFQRLEVFGSLSVRDNLVVAAEMSGKRAGAVDTVLAQVGLAPVAGERADALPTGWARLVEVGRALVTEPRVLLLDEPASGLDDDETDALGSLLAAVAGAGTAVLLVEHDVALVMQVCSTVTVLDAGAVLAVGTPAEVRADPGVLDAYLGTTQ